eukprot:5506120-Prorocentrum_lima.AAC.1
MSPPVENQGFIQQPSLSETVGPKPEVRDRNSEAVRWSPRTSDFDWISQEFSDPEEWTTSVTVSYTHLRAHETRRHL